MIDGDRFALGYVRLWRCSMDSEVWANDALWRVWCYCILKANHKECWVSVKTGRGETQVRVPRGAFIFGRHVAAKELRMKAGSVRDRIAKLARLGNLVVTSDTHYSLISLRNWDRFQAPEEASPTSNPTAAGASR